MMTPWNPHALVEKEISDQIRNEDWFKAKRVTVVEENEGDFATLMKKNLAQIGGVLVVVAIDTLVNFPDACEVNFSVTAIEGVPINRAHNDYASAMDVAQAVAQLIDGEWWHWEEISHESPAEGVLVAKATFKGLVRRIEPPDQTESDPRIKGDD